MITAKPAQWSFILFHVSCLRSSCSNMSSRFVYPTASALGNTAGLEYLTGRLPLDWGSLRRSDGRALAVRLSGRIPNEQVQGLLVCISACVLFFRNLHNQSLSGSLPKAWSALVQVSHPQRCMGLVGSLTNCLALSVHSPLVPLRS